MNALQGSYIGGTAKEMAPEVQRDTAAIVNRLVRARDRLAEVLVSLSIGSASLWGATAEKDSPTPPEPVPNGFFAEANLQLDKIDNLLESASVRASRLRNL